MWFVLPRVEEALKLVSNHLGHCIKGEQHTSSSVLKRNRGVLLSSLNKLETSSLTRRLWVLDRGSPSVRFHRGVKYKKQYRLKHFLLTSSQLGPTYLYLFTYLFFRGGYFEVPGVCIV